MTSKSLHRLLPALLGAITLLVTMMPTACAPAPAKPPSQISPTSQPSDASALPIRWKLTTPRRQINYLKMDLPLVMAGMHIDIATPTGPSPWIGEISVYSSRIVRGAASSPAVEQLTGYPQQASDLGSYLLPTGQKTSSAKTTESFAPSTPMPLYLKVEVSALQSAGEYQFPIKIALSGRPLEELALAVEVSDISLPTDPRVLGIMTTTTQALTRLFPESFAPINATHLDRSDPNQKAAVDQLDKLVIASQQLGMALFVEDIGPEIRVDEVGRVIVKWEVYDRLMQPYMDGSAFPDRVPLPVWLAPVPPRRISDSPTQLRQYVAACAQHYIDRGWIATPAFLHPAMADPTSTQSDSTTDNDPDNQLRAAISQTLRLHMSHDMLAVTTPEARLPQPRLWAIGDGDPHLPPAGPMATEESIRSWPWVCAARTASQQVKGFVWRDAVESADNIGREGALSRPLLVLILDKTSKESPLAVEPSLRMLWLQQGLNDTAMMGLLEHRSDPVLVQEMYAGIVGRTGIAAAPSAPTNIGYLYAGWLTNKDVWDTVPTMLQKLVLANDPGAAVTMAANDPNYIATQVWLANARRPVARISSFTFYTRTARDGDILEGNIGVALENPIDSPVQMDARFITLPGDLQMTTEPSPTDLNTPTRLSLNVPPYGLANLSLPISGHLDSLYSQRTPSLIELTERNGGASVQVPVSLPVYRMSPTDTPLKVDAHGSDWPTLDTPTLSKNNQPMSVAIHYLSRPDLAQSINPILRIDPSPAAARWTYDQNFLYVLIQCPQNQVDDERNNDWPIAGGPGGNRWWATDGVQIQIGDADVPIGATKKIIQLGFKPGGAMLTRTAQVNDRQPLQWKDGPPPVPGEVKYAISILKNDGRVEGYTVEAAIPRTWFSAVKDAAPSWRVNILRHRSNDLASMSWSGPLIDDADTPMMGLLIGSP